MKQLFTLLFSLLIYSLQAQTNYIATSPLSFTPSLFNTIVGPSAGNPNLRADANTFIGISTGAYTIFGSRNTFAGAFAGQNNGASYNTLIGTYAGLYGETGEYNAFLGYSAGQLNISGSSNSFIGGYAGLGNKTGSQNVMLGYNSQPLSDNLNNVVAIGANARVGVNNAIVLGDPYNTSVTVGIGTDSPQFPLDVRGIINIRNNGTIKFSHLSNSLRQGTTDQFLTVNEQGEAVLARYQLRINNPAEWSDKVFSPSYQLQPLAEVKRYIDANQHLPGIPSADQVVKEGVDLVRMNAKLLEKVEELTLYQIEQQKTIKELKAELDELKALIKK